jgi:hypothetical protein
MIDPIQYIQRDILGDVSSVITRKLTEILAGIVREVYNYHDWRCLLRSSTLDLVPGLLHEYTLSGESQDLGKIHAIYYGDDHRPLDEYSDEKEFYRSVYNNVSGDDPVCFVIKGRPNEYSWTILIYPCNVTKNIPYSYKKIMNVNDLNLYPNPMVFVNGVLSKYYLGVAGTVADSGLKMSLIGLARDYLSEYRDGRERMKQYDEAIVHSRQKFVISDQRKRELTIMGLIKAQRKR